MSVRIRRQARCASPTRIPLQLGDQSMLTPRQIEQVKATVPVLREHGVLLTTHFYRRMLEGNPELRNISTRLIRPADVSRRHWPKPSSPTQKTSKIRPCFCPRSSSSPRSMQRSASAPSTIRLSAGIFWPPSGRFSEKRPPMNSSKHGVPHTGSSPT